MTEIVKSIEMDIAFVESVADTLKHFLAREQAYAYKLEKAVLNCLAELNAERQALRNVLKKERARFVGADPLKDSAGSDFPESSPVITTDELPAIPKKAHAKS